MKFNLFKKTIILALLSTLMLSVAACGNKATEAGETDELTAFIEAEDGYNLSILNAVEKYGSLLIEVYDDYDDDEKDFFNMIYLDKDCSYYYWSENEIEYLYEGKLYKKYLYNDEIIYGLYTDYKDDSLATQEDLYLNGFDFASEEDYDKSVTKHDDGTYTWISSYPDGKDETDKSYITTTIELNENYEITKIEAAYFTEDGTATHTQTIRYTVGIESTTVKEEFINELNEGEGKTRHINFYEVSDGNSEKTWEVDLPVGIALFVKFADEYYNDGTVKLYADASLTTTVEVDLYNDIDYYLVAPTKK